MDKAEKNISIEPYNEHYILVTGLEFKNRIEALGGEFLKEVNGWLVNKERKKDIEELKNSISHEILFNTAASTFTSHKEQKKYHRATSDNEESSDEDDSPRKVKLRISKDDLCSSESSDSNEDSDDSDFPEAKSPRNHEKKYKKILKRFRRSPKNKK